MNKKKSSSLNYVLIVKKKKKKKKKGERVVCLCNEFLVPGTNSFMKRNHSDAAFYSRHVNFGTNISLNDTE